MLVLFLFLLILLVGVFLVSANVLGKYFNSEIMQTKYRLLAFLFLISLGVVVLIISSGFTGFNPYLRYIVVTLLWLISRLVMTLHKITLYKSRLNSGDWKKCIWQLVVIKLTILAVILVGQKANLDYMEITLISCIVGDYLVVLINWIEEAGSLFIKWIGSLGDQIVLFHQNFYNIVRNIFREIIFRTSGEKMHLTGQDYHDISPVASKANDIHFINSSGSPAGESNSNHNQEVPIDPLLGNNKEIPVDPLLNDQEVPPVDHKLGNIWIKLYQANYQVTVIQGRSFMKFADRLTLEEYLYLKRKYQWAYPNCVFSHKMQIAHNWTQVGVKPEYIQNIRDLAFPRRSN